MTLSRFVLMAISFDQNVLPEIAMKIPEVNVSLTLMQAPQREGLEDKFEKFINQQSMSLEDFSTIIIIDLIEKDTIFVKKGPNAERIAESLRKTFAKVVMVPIPSIDDFYPN